MKNKRTLQKVTMAAGVVVMSVGLFNSFDLAAETTGGGSKVDWYYHDCLYSSPSKECKTVLSTESCGKAKKRPGLPCP